MAVLLWLPVVGLALGLVVGALLPIAVPVAYAKYLSVAILAALDSVLGGLRALLEDNFDSTIFLTGFFANALLAAGLAYVGDQLGVELYLAAIVAFGVRIFQNLAFIRRDLLQKARESARGKRK